MPKMIKKRAVKKKSSQGDEVKSTALQALDMSFQRVTPTAALILINAETQPQVK